MKFDLRFIRVIQLNSCNYNMATLEPYHTLEVNPRQRFAEIERKVYDDAGSSCLDLLPHGLLALVVSDTVWANSPNNTTIADNVTTTIPRTAYPSPIQPLAPCT